jgi:hypothetical protein
MDFHHHSIALHEKLEADHYQLEDQQPELAYYCEAKNPKTNEVVWDDWVYTEKDRKLRIREADQDGLVLTIDATPDEMWA